MLPSIFADGGLRKQVEGWSPDNARPRLMGKLPEGMPAFWRTPAFKQNLLDFLQPRRLAFQLAQIIELGAPNPARPHHIDLVDHL